MSDIRTLKANYGDQLLDDNNVSSVGIGLDDDGNEVLVVGVKDASAQISVPQALSQSDYEIEEVGDIVPEVAGPQLVPQVDRKAEQRPVPGGVSAGHTNVTAGTTSYLLTDGDETYTSSNNHVYANVNSASPGDTITQPGSADGGSTDSQSAELVDYIPIEDGVTVDLAWASTVVEHTTDIVEIGAPQGEPRRAEAGETVVKSGRTTGVTEGTVDQVEVSVDVNFGSSVGSIRLEDLIMTGDMSDGGDSGSAVLGQSDNAPVGILFAGSDTATVHCQAVNIEETSGLSIVTGDDGGGNGGSTPTATVTFSLESEGPDTGNIEVVVEDEGGDVISGASVSVDGPMSDTASTNTDGYATFEEVEIGSYTVDVDADGYVGESKAIAGDAFS